MRLLLAVESCHRDRHLHAAKRYLKHPDLALRFFIGGDKPDDLAPDEVHLPVEDFYLRLPEKTTAICKYALDHGYDFVAKMDNDVKLNLWLFMHSGFQNYDYCGGFDNDDDPNFAYGAFYVLSKRAMQLVAQNTKLWGSEDRIVSDILQPYLISGEFKKLHLDNTVFCFTHEPDTTVCKSCGVPLIPEIDGGRFSCAKHDYGREGLKMLRRKDGVYCWVPIGIAHMAVMTGQCEYVEPRVLKPEPEPTQIFDGEVITVLLHGGVKARGIVEVLQPRTMFRLRDTSRGLTIVKWRKAFEKIEDGVYKEIQK